MPTICDNCNEMRALLAKWVIYDTQGESTYLNGNSLKRETIKLLDSYFLTDTDPGDEAGYGSGV